MINIARIMQSEKYYHTIFKLRTLLIQVFSLAYLDVVTEEWQFYRDICKSTRENLTSDEACQPPALELMIPAMSNCTHSVGIGQTFYQPYIVSKPRTDVS